MVRSVRTFKNPTTTRMIWVRFTSLQCSLSNCLTKKLKPIELSVCANTFLIERTSNNLGKRKILNLLLHFSLWVPWNNNCVKGTVPPFPHPQWNHTSSFVMLSCSRRFSSLPRRKNMSPACWFTIQHNPWTMFFTSVSGHSQSTCSKVRSCKKPSEYSQKVHMNRTTSTCQMAYAIRQAFLGRLLDTSSSGENHCPAMTKYQRAKGLSNAMLSVDCISLGSSFTWMATLWGSTEYSS